MKDKKECSQPKKIRAVHVQHLKAMSKEVGKTQEKTDAGLRKRISHSIWSIYWSLKPFQKWS